MRRKSCDRRRCVAISCQSSAAPLRLIGVALARASSRAPEMGTSEAVRPMGLSKSRVMAGLQCHKLLWWMVHEPEAPELALDGQTQAVMDRGSHVGEVARRYVP